MEKDILPDPIGMLSEKLGEAGKKFLSSLTLSQLSQLSVTLDSFFMDMTMDMVVSNEPKEQLMLKGGLDAISRIKDIVRKVAQEKKSEQEAKENK